MRLSNFHNYTPFKAPLRATKSKDPTDFSGIILPAWGTPKLDGIRTMTQPVSDGDRMTYRAMSRTFKRLPNDKWASLIESYLIPKLDGESWMPDTPYGEIESAVMSHEHDATDDLRYAVFDWAYDLQRGYLRRMWALANLKLPAFCEKILPVEIRTMKDLVRYERECFKKGFEGVMLRSPDGEYKQGQSTFKEQILTKVKRFLDSEAICVGVTELMHNDNEKTRDNLGRAARSSHKGNLRPSGMLGALVCKLPDGTDFSVGSGFTKQQRIDFWKARDTMIGKIVSFRYQPFGQKDRPRFPKFLRFRHPIDILI